MVFSSVQFLLYFLPIFFILYGLTPDKFKNVMLTAASLVFYAMGEPRYLGLLLLSVLVNYFAGLHLGVDWKKGSHNRQKQTKLKFKNDKKRKILLIASVIGNIGVLILFKAGVGEKGLPLGISFYTFQILSYLIEVYQGKIQRERSFLKFTTYITMFPKLISGPIVSYDEVEKDLSYRKFSLEKLQDGLQLFVVGLAAKVLLADRVGILWHEVQVTGFESISTPLAWLAALAYAMQIYFDFYGYSLMAVGLGRMLGFELPINFKTPYMARSVRDFYRRWHITLGRWFCRYVYIPLGGNRKGELRTICNLLVVWVLTAVWHGSTINFLIWGLLLVTCIIIERQLEKTGIIKRLKVLPHVYLWFVILISWMCFAITDLGQLQVYLGRMFHVVEGISVRSGDWLAALENYGGLFLVAILGCTPLMEKLYRKCKDHLVGKLMLAALFWICVRRLMIEGDNPFMYFQF